MKKKLGEILVTTGAVTGADIDDALREQSAGEPSRLGDLLVASGKLTASQLAQALAEQYHLPYVDLPPLPQAVLDLVPMELQRQFRFVPLRSDGPELHVAMADLANLEVVATLEQSWTKVHVNVASGDEIDALHATLSGLFSLPAEAPAPARSPTIDELFGSLDLDPSPPVMGTALDPLPEDPLPEVPSVSPSAVMRIASAVTAAPLQTDAAVVSAVPGPAMGSPLPSPSRVPSIAPLVAAPPVPRLGDDLFSDLNLESARTGIAAKAPGELFPPPPVKTVTAPLGIATSVTVLGPPVPDPLPDVEPRAPSASPPTAIRETSGPVLVGVPEGTGPLLDMLAREGTGPVVDTPFFNDALAGPLVPTMSDAPFVSSRSAVSAVAISVSPVPAPAPSQVEAPASEALPDWLRGDAPGASPQSSPSALGPPPLSAPPAPQAPQPWTGALDHLMPSKLVVGLTRALLARGLVTEEEILAALGQKK